MFHDENLKKIEQEFRQASDDYNKFLDKISEDIRSLELLFSSTSLGLIKISIPGGGCVLYDEKRVRYHDGHYVNSRPLIETKAQTRVNVFPYLVKLAEACLQELKKGAL